MDYINLSASYSSILYCLGVLGRAKYQNPIIPNGIKITVPRQNKDKKNNKIFDIITYAFFII
jgi:hypothetical protein